MQASLPCYAHKILLGNIFYFGNLIYYCFKTLQWVYESPRNLFELNWINVCKIIERIQKNQKSKRKRIKKIRKGLGKPFGPASEGAHGPTNLPTQTGTSGLTPTLTGGAHLSGRHPPPARDPEGHGASGSHPIAPSPKPQPISQAHPAIKSPGCPPLSPFRLSTRDKPRTTNFVAGLRHSRRHLRSIPTPPVSPASFFPTYPLYFSLAFPLTPVAHPNSQQNIADIDIRSSPPPRTTPAVPPSAARMQSRSSTKLWTSPRRAEHRRSFAVVQKPL
jgi:hypothetical protein